LIREKKNICCSIQEVLVNRYWSYSDALASNWKCNDFLPDDRPITLNKFFGKGDLSSWFQISEEIITENFNASELVTAGGFSGFKSFKEWSDLREMSGIWIPNSLLICSIYQQRNMQNEACSLLLLIKSNGRPKLVARNSPSRLFPVFRIVIYCASLLNYIFSPCCIYQTSVEKWTAI